MIFAITSCGKPKEKPGEVAITLLKTEGVKLHPAVPLQRITGYLRPPPSAPEVVLQFGNRHICLSSPLSLLVVARNTDSIKSPDFVWQARISGPDGVITRQITPTKNIETSLYSGEDGVDIELESWTGKLKPPIKEVMITADSSQSFGHYYFRASDVHFDWKPGRKGWTHLYRAEQISKWGSFDDRVVESFVTAGYSRDLVRTTCENVKQELQNLSDRDFILQELATDCELLRKELNLREALCGIYLQSADLAPTSALVMKHQGHDLFVIQTARKTSSLPFGAFLREVDAAGATITDGSINLQVIPTPQKLADQIVGLLGESKTSE